MNESMHELTDPTLPQALLTSGGQAWGASPPAAPDRAAEASQEPLGPPPAVCYFPPKLSLGNSDKVE